MLEETAVQRPVCRVLSNGVTLKILNAGDNEVVRVDLLFKSGSWNQTQLLQALFTTRMLREGTHRYTAAQIAEKLDYYGACLELYNTREYAIVTLYSLNKYLPQTLDVLLSVVKEPTFPEKELGVIVANYLQQFLINYSKVNFLATRALWRALFGSEHPCGRIAEREDYNRISSEVLRSFYDCFFHSQNCTIYLSGKVSEDCIHRIEALFGTEPFGKEFNVPETHLYKPVPIADKAIFVERADAMQSAVCMGTASVGYTHPDCLKMSVLVTLLGGYFGSRLMSNIREEKGYTYDISAGVTYYPGGSVLTIEAETTHEFVKPLITEVYHEIDRLQNELVQEEELVMVRNYLLGDFCRSYESAFSLAESWMSVQMSGYDENYFADMLNTIKSITPTEIRELAMRYLCKENIKEVVSGKKM